MIDMFSEDEKVTFRRIELAKYDQEYFATEYWKEDLPGVRGNRGLSYNDAFHRERFDLLAEAIVRNTKPNKILDAGCGPGLLLAALRRLCGATLMGVDAASAALLTARSELAQLADSTNVELHQANLIQLPFGSAEFDVVVCLDVLEHLPVFDVENALRELLRVGSGQFVFSINTDNAYRYHPTVLSKETWRALFASQPSLRTDRRLEDALNSQVKAVRDEYDFFCYVNLQCVD